MRGWVAALALAIFTVAAPCAWADPDLVSVGVGGTDILRPASRAAVDFRLDYRSHLSLLPFFEEVAQLRPWLGVETTSRQSVWGGGGIYLDIPLGHHWVLTPAVGVGAYGVGDGKDLGSPLEFRSTFEGGYVFDDGARLVTSFGHTSNGGVARHNPGTEQALLSYQVPLATLLAGR